MTMQIEKLSHWYTRPEEALYRDVNLTFEAGKFYAIIGESGSGKTTFLSFLAGLDIPSQGEIKVNHRSQREYGLTNYRRTQVSTIFQSYNLLPTMSAYQNVNIALAITKSAHHNDKDYILASLAKVGIDETKAKQRVQRLSGGEQQRVAIVRAALVDAPIVLADEPTGNLDHDNSVVIVDLFKSLVADYGKTVIMITHDQGVAALADEQILLKDKQFTKVPVMS